MYNSDRINYLLQQIQNRQASQAECDELLQQLEPSASAELIKQIGSYHQKLAELSTVSLPPYHKPEWQPVLRDILATDKVQNQPAAISTRRLSFLKTAWLRYAAVLILAVGVYYLWGSKKPSTGSQENLAETSVIDVKPGKEGAILTLADGKQIVLDSMGNGMIAAQNGSKVLLNNGQLTYALTGDGETESASNTITTPKGRQFQIILPDGTRVWLNAASSLRYPTAFTGQERKVEVTGEAYFEVAQNSRHPFLVNIGNRAILKVLGTSFNVNAYENEAGIHTTLVEGSVRVIKDTAAKNQPNTIASGKNNQSSVILTPQQQAQLVNNQLSVIKNVDIGKVMAWKNGTFNFDGAGLEEVMRQLERWYDIEVVYEKGIPDIHFVGELSREISLAGLLRTLKASKVQFRMEGARKLIVFH